MPLNIRAAILMILLAVAGATASTNDDLNAEFGRNLEAKQQALKELRARLMAQPPRVSQEYRDGAKIKSYFSNLGDDGRFKDIADKAPENWITGMGRLNAMAAAYRRMPEADRKPLAGRMYAGIVYYSAQAVAHPDPFVQAAFLIPRHAAAIYFTLYDELQTAQRKPAADALKQALFLCWYWPINKKETHRKDDPYRLDVFLNDPHFTVGNTTYRPIAECAVALESTKMLDVVHAIIVRSLHNRTSYQTEKTSLWGEQGLTMDGNGMAHSRQSYLFGYIRDWFNGAAGIATLLKGTPWEIAPTSWDLAADMVLDGQQWYVYRGDIDWSTSGRHNLYPGLIMDGDDVLQTGIKDILRLSEGTVQRKSELEALRQRIERKEEFSGNRYFWNVEDMLHRRPDYYMSVNLTSVRSNGPENVTPYSVANYHFPFGSMMIKTRGDEYRQVRGALNYSALPGVTADITKPPPADRTWDGFHGENTFCGGVSDGDIGVAGFILDQSRLPVSGHKGYFFFDGGCVALGAGISTGNIETTLNQTQWSDDARFAAGVAAQQLDRSGMTCDFAVDQPIWFLNDAVGYLILPTPTKSVARLRTETRTTRWAELAQVNQGKPGTEASQVRVFQLSISHENQNDHYAYAILPHATAEQLSRYAKTPPFTVLANTPEAQAVRFDESGIVQAIFYAPGQVQHGEFVLAVDRPAVVMLRPEGKNWHLYVADPMQREEAGFVTIRTSLPLSSELTSKNGVLTQLKCQLPAKPWIGKAAHFAFVER